MTIGIDQYRIRVGLIKPNRQQSKCYLNLYEVLCIGLIINTRNKKHALLTAVLISCLTEFKVENNPIASTCKVDDFDGYQGENTNSNMTSCFRFVDKRAIYRWYNLVHTCAGECERLFYWQHKWCATLSANVNMNYRLPIKVCYRICNPRHIRIEINHGSMNVF